MNWTKYFFFTRNKRITSILTQRQLSKVRYHVALGILLSMTEVISLAVFFPLFLQLTQNDQATVTLPFSSLSFNAGSKNALLASVVVIFVVKNSVAIWLTQHQLRFINSLYIEFSKKVYQGYFQLEWTDYTKENSSDIFHKVKNTAYDFANNVLGNYYLLITDTFTCGLMTLALIWFDFRIVFALIVLCLPIVILYFFFRRKVIQKIDRSFRKLIPQANIILSQGIESFAEARLYKTESHFIQRFINIISTTSSHLASLKIYAQLPARVIETLGVLLIVALILYAQAFPGQQATILVMMGLLALALYRIVPSLNRIVLSLSQIQAYSYSISALEKLAATENGSSSGNPSRLPFEFEIQLESIFFSYTKEPLVPVLEKASSTIKKGEFVLLEGPSGAGKTTLLYLIAGLIKDYEGKILVDGTRLIADHLITWQSKIGIVQQTPVILQDSILNNICIGAQDEATDMERLDAILKLCGIYDYVYALPQTIHTVVGEHGITISGGQRQRLSIARALYRNPEILLLDEVTNQLDEENKKLILLTLQKLSAAGKTIIFSSHDSLVKDFASRILRLENGALHERPVAK